MQRQDRIGRSTVGSATGVRIHLPYLASYWAAAKVPLEPRLTSLSSPAKVHPIRATLLLITSPKLACDAFHRRVCLLASFCGSDLAARPRTSSYFYGLASSAILRSEEIERPATSTDLPNHIRCTSLISLKPAVPQQAAWIHQLQHVGGDGSRSFAESKPLP